MSTPKGVRVVGLITALSYLTAMLFVWIYQDIVEGDAIIRFYEINIVIKYAEWIIGIFSMLVLIHIIIDETNTEK